MVNQECPNTFPSGLLTLWLRTKDETQGNLQSWGSFHKEQLQLKVSFEGQGYLSSVVEQIPSLAWEL